MSSSMTCLWVEVISGPPGWFERLFCMETSSLMNASYTFPAIKELPIGASPSVGKYEVAILVALTSASRKNAITEKPSPLTLADFQSPAQGAEQFESSN